MSLPFRLDPPHMSPLIHTPLFPSIFSSSNEFVHQNPAQIQEQAVNMGTRTLTNTVNPDIIALNAAIFRYGGHSILTPHIAIQQIWWTDAHIEAKVTPDFVNSKLRSEARQPLYYAIGFGDGLTDDTYMDWILSRAKRLFLTLVECGVPEQIFGMVDDSWNDDDLPISQDEAVRLSQRDQRLGKFYTAQFQFLLRQLNEGSHIDYEPNEIVPLEYIHRLPPAAVLQKRSRVQIPEPPERVYVRRKVSFGGSDGEDLSAKERFLADVETSRIIQNQHIAPVWATYTTKNSAYFLTSFIGEHTLKSFIDFRTPASFQRIERADRYLILLNWLYCLADAVSCLHENGICHTAIMPSNILIDIDNNIAFSDIGSLQSFQMDKKFDSNEYYNYGAPENYSSPTLDPDEDQPARPKSTSPSRFRLQRRKRSAESKISSSSGRQSQQGTYDGRSFGSISTLSVDCQATYLPVQRSSTKSTSTTSRSRSYHSSSLTRIASVSSNAFKSSSLSENGMVITVPPPIPPKSGKTPPRWCDTSSSLDSVVSPYAESATTATYTQGMTASGASAEAEKAADVFALGCIYLDILTFLLKHKLSDFAKHRSAKTSKAFKSSKVFSFSTNGSGSGLGSTGQIRKLDSSFHANLDKVHTWMAKLEHDAFDFDHPAFRAVSPLLEVIKGMLCLAPSLRPTAAVVRERVKRILVGRELEGLPHCA